MLDPDRFCSGEIALVSQQLREALNDPYQVRMFRSQHLLAHDQRFAIELFRLGTVSFLMEQHSQIPQVGSQYDRCRFRVVS